MTAILKIGGSVLTDKSRIFSTRVGVAAALAEDIRLSGSVPIVVHGTGSSARAFARHYAAPGRRSSDAVVFQMTTGRIRHLQEQLLRAFQDAGVACSPLSSNALFHRTHNQLELYSVSPIRHLLAAGVVPVLCGDILVDGPKQFGIVSSDEIALTLARACPIDQAVFATDVDGVWDEKGNVIATFSSGQKLFSSDSDRLDVTGGMQAKVGVARELGLLGVQTTIVNGLVPGRVRDALMRRPVLGTRVIAIEHPTTRTGRRA